MAVSIDTFSIDQFESKLTGKTVSSLDIVAIAKSRDSETQITAGEKSVSADQTNSSIVRVNDFAVVNFGNDLSWDAKIVGAKLEIGDARDASSCGEFVGATVGVHGLAGVVGDNESRVASQAKTIVLVGAVWNRSWGWSDVCIGIIVGVNVSVSVGVSICVSVGISASLGIGSIRGSICGCCSSI